MITLQNTFLLLIFIFSNSLPLISQSELQGQQEFRTNTISEYNRWLSNRNINKFLYAENIAVLPDKIVLTISSNYPNDSLYQYWHSLIGEYQSINQRIDKEMLDNFMLLFELDRDAAEIQIIGKDPKEFTIRLFYNDYYFFDTKEQISKKMASKNFEIIIDSIFSNNLQSSESLSNSSIEKVGLRIQSCLKTHFDSLDAQEWIFWRRSSALKIIPREYDEIELKVACISNEVLTTELFEFLRINIQLRARPKTIDILLDVKGKYSSGYSCPEFRAGRYYSMENNQEYLEMLEDYVHVLSGEIRKCLKE